MKREIRYEYIAFDNTSFDTEEECIAYEKENWRERNKIKTLVANARFYLESMDKFCKDWQDTNGCECDNCPYTDLCAFVFEGNPAENFVETFNKNNPIGNINNIGEIIND